MKPKLTGLAWLIAAIRSLRISGVFGVLFACVGLSACAPEPASSTKPAAANDGAAAVEHSTASELTPRQAQMWAQSCALCHVDGNAAAPRVGHSEEWQPRLAKGADQLLENTLHGLRDMPPLGYCMACERADFSAMIAFMTEGLGAPAISDRTTQGES